MLFRSAMDQVWQEAEAMVAKVPPLAKMFGGSAQAFWRKACCTATKDSPVTLQGCYVEETPAGVFAEWFGADGKTLGCHRYVVESVVEKGLEGKPNFIFFAPDAPESWPFRYVMAMEPMPERSAREHGGLISHVHFQFAARRESLVDASQKLVNPMWYPTFCDAAGSLLEQCNIVRALHKLPAWNALPEQH